MTNSPMWLLPDDIPIDWRSKSFGPDQQGYTIAEIVARGTVVSDLPTPVMTIDKHAVEHNIDVMNDFIISNDVELCPHGKTTMSPQLWHRQLTAGAWGITVATPWQLRVAATHGIRRIMHAGAMLDASDLADVGRFLDTESEAQIIVWADSPAVALQIAAKYPTGSRPLDVLVDRGGPGARTGARTLEQSIATAEAIARAPNLRLAGVAAWEGSLIGASKPDGRELLAAFCDGAAQTFRMAIEQGLLRAKERPVITGGGSAYFDIVVNRWRALRELGARIVLRSGCYLTHDDGPYAASSPFGRTVQGSLVPALHIWGQVVSRPEPRLALLNIGRRDAPFDSGLPSPQKVRGRSIAESDAALENANIIALNDQHAYLSLAPTSSITVGDVIRCGIAHPCTAFDKWSIIPIVNDADQPDPMIIGAVRTVF